MKKIIMLWAMLLGMALCAQNQVVTKPLRLDNVPTGTKSDSLLVRGLDRVVKMLPVSSIEKPTPTLQQVSDAGAATTNPIAITTTDPNYEGINSITATSDNGTGVNASSDNGTGVNAYSTNGYGVTASSTDGTGVNAYSTNGYGVNASSADGIAVYASSNTSNALIANIATANTSNIAEFKKNNVNKVVIQNDGKITATAGTANTDVVVVSQLNTKANIASPTFTGTVTLPSTTSIGTVSDTELNYLDGVTSNIQTQLGGKAVDTNVLHKIGDETKNGILNIIPSSQDEFEYGARTIVTIRNQDTESSTGEGYGNALNVITDSVYGDAISATSNSGNAINANSYSSTALAATSINSYAIDANSYNNVGVRGQGAIGVQAIANTGVGYMGLFAQSYNGRGIYTESLLGTPFQANTSSSNLETNNIAEFQKGGVNQASISRDGKVTANSMNIQSSESDLLTFKTISNDVLGSVVSNSIHATFNSTSPDGTLSFNSAGINTTKNALYIATTGSTPRGLLGATDYSANITDLNYVQKIYVDSKTNGIALKTITEGGQTGHRVTTSDPANFGDIGVDAVDFSYSSGASSTAGATGESSFAQGTDVITSAYGAVGFGSGLNVGGIQDFATGINNATAGYANFVTGVGHDIAGLNMTVVGQASNVITQSLLTHNEATSPVFVVGNGTITDGDPDYGVVTRSDALIVRKNGVVEAPSQSVAEIDAGTDKTLTTKEWVVNRVSSGTYTPTFTNVANTGSFTTNTATYTIIGDIVTVRVAGGFTPTSANTQTQFSITLPVNMSGASQNSLGSGVCGGNSFLPILVQKSSVSLVKAYLKTGDELSAQSFAITFSYQK